MLQLMRPQREIAKLSPGTRIATRIESDIHKMTTVTRVLKESGLTILHRGGVANETEYCFAPTKHLQEKENMLLSRVFTIFGHSVVKTTATVTGLISGHP